VKRLGRPPDCGDALVLWIFVSPNSFLLRACLFLSGRLVLRFLHLGDELKPLFLEGLISPELAFEILRTGSSDLLHQFAHTSYDGPSSLNYRVLVLRWEFANLLGSSFHKCI
jgi:hypothetical protein